MQIFVNKVMAGARSSSRVVSGEVQPQPVGGGGGVPGGSDLGFGSSAGAEAPPGGRQPASTPRRGGARGGRGADTFLRTYSERHA